MGQQAVEPSGSAGAPAGDEPAARPVGLCLERVGAPSEQRFVRCVALVGRTPGLALASDGAVRWAAEQPAAIELCVAADGRLVAYRRAGAPACRVQRAGREYDLPEERPAFLLHRDVLALGEERLRVHVHGASSHVFAPAVWLPPRRPTAFRAAAAAVAVGATVVAVGSSRGAAAQGADDGGVCGDGGMALDGGAPADCDGSISTDELDASAGAAEPDPIIAPLEVREAPPVELPPPTPPPGCCGGQPGMEDMARGRAPRRR